MGSSAWVDSWAYFDSRRQPVIGPYGCASMVQEGGHPSYGNYTTRCFGPDGEPMLSAYYGASVLEGRREGRERQNIRRGLDGEVVVQTDQRYDERDLLIAHNRLDARSGQTARLRLAYDEPGHEVRRWYVGDDDELVLGPDSWAERRRTVDERGNALSETYFDADGEPINRPGSAYHEQRSTFDALDRPLSVETFDADGEPALDEGVYGQRYTYDARGNVLRIVNLLPEDSDHWARIDRTYDSFGRQTSARSYDADDAPLDVAEGESPPVAGWEVRYDPFGRPMERRWFGADALPKACPAGFSEVELDWNDRDRTLTVAFRHEDTAVLLSDGAAFPWWGKADGEDAVGPMHQQTGIQAHKLRGMAGLRVELDTQRRLSGARFLGSNLKPVVVHGVWGYRQTWDANGRVTEVQWVDREGEPAVHQELGWAIRNDSYDATGELTSSETLDAQRNPIVRSDG
ncbi:MAG: hypothetical protein KC912_20295 [Proteobacteria bacterium]|nr:hypothetical protein [Pseudomonadota bacterium]